ASIACVTRPTTMPSCSPSSAWRSEAAGARRGDCLSRRREAPMSTEAPAWPALPLLAWQDTYHTLHMYTQIIGKVRLALSPMMNEWWQVPFYLTARGLGTSPIPHDHRSFDVELDFVDHEVVFRASDGRRRTIALVPRAVADFHAEVMRTLGAMGLDVAIHD